MKKVIVSLLCLFILLQIVNVISHKIIFDRTSYELLFNIPVFSRGALLPWLNFDGKNYLAIAEYGYEVNKQLAVFFPLYPLLIRVFSFNLTFNPILVGLLISAVSTLVAVIVLYKLIQIEYSEKIATRSIALLLLFPTSFYLFAYYTEGIFLLFSVLFFWFIKKNNLFLASVFVFFATATRLVGLALIPPLIFEAYKIHKKENKIAWSVLISPLGFAFYAIFNYLKFGNPLLMITAQTSFRFGRAIDILSPFHIFKGAVVKIISGPLPSYDSPFVYPVIILEFLFAVYSLVILYFSFRKLPKSYFLYILFLIVLIFYSSALSSIGRYILVIFPIYVLLALTLPRKIFVVWSLISFFLLIFASSLFLRNYWIA